MTRNYRLRPPACRPAHALLIAVAALLATGIESVRGEEESHAVMKANEAFYEVFRSRDLAAMDQLWAQGVPVAVIHPGWPGVHGREEVMASWRGILRNPASPQVRPVDPQVYRYGETAFVVCYESIGEDVLIATNVFVKQGGGWKLVHHQAGPTFAALPRVQGTQM